MNRENKKKKKGKKKYQLRREQAELELRDARAREMFALDELNYARRNDRR